MVVARELKRLVVEHFKGCIDKDLLEVDTVDTNAEICKLVDRCDHHAHWIDGRCSHCGRLIPTQTMTEFVSEDDMQFCPWCGYEMEDE